MSVGTIISVVGSGHASQQTCPNNCGAKSMYFGGLEHRGKTVFTCGNKSCSAQWIDLNERQ